MQTSTWKLPTELHNPRPVLHPSGTASVTPFLAVKVGLQVHGKFMVHVDGDRGCMRYALRTISCTFNRARTQGQYNLNATGCCIVLHA